MVIHFTGNPTYRPVVRMAGSQEPPAPPPVLPALTEDIAMFRKPDSPYIMRTPAYPTMLDEAGFVKAGHVLKLIDISGSVPALRHLNGKGSKGSVVTASLDRTNFEEPIRRWEMIRLESRISQVWNTSLETQVKVKAESIYSGDTRDIATAYLTFVALDRSRNKIAFPAYKPKSCEEQVLAQSADLRKQNRKKEGSTAPFIPIDDKTDNPVVVRRVMTEDDQNAQSNVFGGIILSIIDEAGSQAARRQALAGHVVGVRQDRMSFLAPTFVGEMVESKAIVTKTWQTSMEVQVEVEAVNPNTGQRRKVASSYLVYVKLGPNNRPAEVPPFEPGTDLQRQRAERADVRRQIRLEEEKEADVMACPIPPRRFWSGLMDRLRKLGR